MKNYTGPNIIDKLNISTIKDLCYKGVSKTLNVTKKICPRVFDGIKCWKEATLGQTLIDPCPDYVIGFDVLKSASKTCGQAGSWLDEQDTKDSWPNYANCTMQDNDNVSIRDKVSHMYMCGYGFSSFILVLTLFIFLFFRNVHCSRVRVHVNLYLAVIFSNIMFMTWYVTVIKDTVVILFNPIWCQVMHVLTYYSIVSSHFWMFGEGLHLYLAVAFVYSRSKDSLLLFIGIGWVSPVLILAVYSALRIFYLHDTENCWTADSNAFYIITVFVFGALLISSFLLLNVVCILFQMARRFPRHNRMIAMIKATKAALVLTPLFALHFYLIPMHLSRQNALQTTYQILSAVVVTLQGLSLAITFCFTNQDVIASFRQLFKRRQPENEVNIAMTDMSGAHVPQQVTMLQRDVPI